MELDRVNKPRKRRDMTDIMLKARKNNNQTNNCISEQGFQNLKLVDGGGNNESMTGYIEILYNGTWTRLCDKLHSEAPDVFCKTISNGAWV